MTGLEAVDRLRTIDERQRSLRVIIDYMDDDRDFSDELYHLRELLHELEAEYTRLSDLLSGVRL